MEPVTSPKSRQAESGAATAASATTNAARQAGAGRRDKRGIISPRDGQNGVSVGPEPCAGLPNIAPRPIVHAINRQTVDLSEEEQHYRIAIECRAARAADTRAELVKDVSNAPDLHFSELDSAFIERAGPVEVTATVTSTKWRELALETIVGRASPTSRASSARPGGGARRPLEGRPR